MKKLATFVLLCTMLLSLCACGSSSSHSGKKYGDLSEQEKANAKWAYEVSQAIKGK